MYSCVLVQLKPSREKDEGQLGLKLSVIELPGSGTAQSIKDAKNAAYKLVYGVVRRPEPPQSTALIETCAEMCRTEGVDFAEVLQDPISGGHGTLYFIIANLGHPDRYGLLCAILSHSGPLSSKAINEVDLACMIARDWELFSHLWRLPAYHGLSGTHEPSFGSTSPADHVGMEHSHYDGFMYRFEITQFHKRMSTSGRIALKFIDEGLSPSCQLHIFDVFR